LFIRIVCGQLAAKSQNALCPFLSYAEPNNANKSSVSVYSVVSSHKTPPFQINTRFMMGYI